MTNKYDIKTISTFDIVGSYFVDIFYNNHYLLSKDNVRRGHADTVTDAYRTNVISYMDGIKNRQDLYKKVVKQLHEYYQLSTNSGSIVLSDFQDRILSHFIPPEYYKDFTENQKDKTLRDVIIKTVSNMGAVVSKKEMLYKIIDDHSNTNNVTILQDKMVNILMMQREEYYEKFAQQISKSGGGLSVSQELFDKLKQAFIEEKQKSYHLNEDKERAIVMIKSLLNKIKVLESEIQKINQKLEEKTMQLQQQQYVKPVIDTQFSLPSQPITDNWILEPVVQTSTTNSVSTSTSTTGGNISTDDDDHVVINMEDFVDGW
jgi:hypothetical protein